VFDNGPAVTVPFGWQLDDVDLSMCGVSAALVGKLPQVCCRCRVRQLLCIKLTVTVPFTVKNPKYCKRPTLR